MLCQGENLASSVEVWIYPEVGRVAGSLYSRSSIEYSLLDSSKLLGLCDQFLQISQCSNTETEQVLMLNSMHVGCVVNTIAIVRSVAILSIKVGKTQKQTEHLEDFPSKQYTLIQLPLYGIVDRFPRVVSTCFLGGVLRKSV